MSLLLCVGFEFEDGRVHAEALACGWRTIVEDVAEVRIATATEDFGAAHAMGVVVFVTHTSRCKGFVETGPAAATGELGIGFKKRVAANGTVVGAFRVCFVILAAEGVLCAFIPGDVVDIRRQYFLPLCIANVQVRGVCAGIVWIVFFVCHSSICLPAIARPGEDRSKKGCQYHCQFTHICP